MLLRLIILALFFRASAFDVACGFFSHVGGVGKKRGGEGALGMQLLTVKC